MSDYEAEDAPRATTSTGDAVRVEKVFALPAMDTDWEEVTSETLNRFMAVQDHTGTYFPYHKHGAVVGYKRRRHTDDHKFRFDAVGDMKGTDLFGQYLCGGKGSLVITEGEKDAMSVWQMVGLDTVSIPTGTAKTADGTGVIHKGVKAQEQFLERYETIYLCLDQDEAGVATAEALAQWLGSKAKVVRFALKDANEMLQAGEVEAFKRAIDQAQSYRPQRILNPSDLRNKLLSPPVLGLPYPWPTLTEMTRGIHFGESAVVCWGAGVKVGKTDSAMELAKWCVQELNEKVGMFYLENSPFSTMKIVGAKILQQNGLRHEDAFTVDQVDKLIKDTENRVFLYDHYGDSSWESIKKDITWMRLSEGVRIFFVDPLTAMAPGDPSQANAFLNDLLKDMASLCMELDIHINIYSHLNAPQNGVSHEEGGMVRPIQFTGSKAMIRYSGAVIGISRNIMAEDQMLKSTSTFQVLLNRFNGETGNFRVFYHKDTGEYSEKPLTNLVGGGQRV